MMNHQCSCFIGALALLCVGTVPIGLTGCSTVPKAGDRVAFVAETEATTGWFEDNVYGLKKQIERSAGYLVFPGVGQMGVIFVGGQFGRAALYHPEGQQIGWGSVHTGSLGLQAGVQGFKMLIVFEDDEALQRFKDGDLTGNASAVAVLGESGASGTAPFENGVAVYQGANKGLMAGVNIGLDYLRYRPMDN